MNNPNKICMVSIHTENFNSLADITWNQNKMLYCQKKGYDSVLQVQSAPYEEKHKYLLIKSLADRKKYDYIFWCDCDTLVTNFSKNIEDVIDPNFDFVLASDCNGLNLGVFLLRVSEKGIKFLDYIIDNIDSVKSRYHLGEGQTMIQDLYESGKFLDTIKMIPQRLINSYARPDPTPNDKLDTDSNWKKGDFILHIPGYGPDLHHIRMQHFSHFIKEVI